MIGRLYLARDVRHLSVFQFEDYREELRRAIAPVLVARAMPDLDLGDVLGEDRAVTQAISGWAYDRGDEAILYPSRLAFGARCWAVFDRVACERVIGRPVSSTDPDLLAAVRRLELRV